MRAKIEVSNLIVPSYNAEAYLLSRLVCDRFPRFAQALGLLVWTHYRGTSGNDLSRIQLSSGEHDRLKDVRRGHFEQMHGLSGFFCQRHDFAEEILFVSRE